VTSQITHHVPIKKITPNDDKNYFFGYFDKCPWDKSQRYLLAHQTDFIGRQPTADERAKISVIDLQNDNELIPLAETKAFCWQQGSMLQWLNDKETEIIYNDRDGDRFVSRIIDIKTGHMRTFPLPIYCLSPDGKYALSVNFSRLDRERPGYGYAGCADPTKGMAHPEKDGISLMNMKTGKNKLLMSLDQIVKILPLPSFTGHVNWFNHLLFSPNSKRFAFFHRWRTENGWHLTRMFTANTDGSDIYSLNMDDMSSHYTWIDDEKIICFCNKHATGWGYYILTDKRQEVKMIGSDLFDNDGHCSFSIDGRWMLTDTYPSKKENIRTLMLYDSEKNIRYDIGQFYADPNWPMPTRCDLHPNWSRDCKKVCIDSIHEGSRHIYMADVREIIE